MSFCEIKETPNEIEIEDLELESNQHLLAGEMDSPPQNSVIRIHDLSEDEGSVKHKHVKIAVSRDTTPTLSDRSTRQRNTLPSAPQNAVGKKSRPGTEKIYRRLVFKNGECNMVQMNIQKKSMQFLIDIFTTVIDMKWRYSFLIFVCAFVISWVVFAVIWWIMCYAHDDLLPENLANSDYKMCVLNVNDFATALLFSIETQHTIGYGARMVTSNCPEGIIVLMIQSCFGVLIQVFVTGIIFAKLTRPKMRTLTLMFSNKAVIGQRDGKRMLIFRVGDMRKSHFICSTIRGIFLKKRITAEGEIIPLEQASVAFGTNDGADSNLFLVWPVLICHTIDKDSPFWNMSCKDFTESHFELVIILEGVAESTGQTTQARCSYMPQEILWGYQFQQMVTYQKNRGGFQMDFTNFNDINEIPNFSNLSAHDHCLSQEAEESSKTCQERDQEVSSELEVLDTV